ncbi:Pkinase-domain-containing protein [Obba rivulosa]|uniref:Pkinase-domain-containing protein n=1 Tax=Obba rivulosa TaxID=1052685 RepID=A0A8E2DP38_9APHY|nr:Pkinase-domain-containing protein [Obba rivulosa]
MPEPVVQMTRDPLCHALSLPPSSSSPSAYPTAHSASNSVSTRLRDSAAKMLKFWPSTPAGDLTPRAGPNGQERHNPFEMAIANTIQQQQQQQCQQQAAQSPGLASSASSTAATPYQHSLLFAPSQLLSPSISAPGSELAPQQLASAPLTPGGSTFNPSALPTTSLSLHAPVFNMQQPPPSKRSPAPTTPAPSSRSPSVKSSSTNGVSTPTSTVSSTSASSASMNPSGPSKGQIHVKLIQARGLNVHYSTARPYVVVQFEQNEFVGRDPTDETGKEVKGVATALSRNSSSTALSALGAIKDKAVASRAGSARGSGPSTPSSSFSSGKSLANGVFGSRVSAHNPVWKHEVSFDVISEQSVITFNVYDRNAADTGFLGTVQIKPTLIHDHTVDQWYKLRPFENEPVSGEMRVQITFEANKTKRALTPRDFEFLKLIGRGTFGRVFQVRKRDTKRIYAMKVLSKREIIAKKEVAHTIGERKILQRSLESPFLVGLKFSFQTDTDLYLVTDFKSGGELFWHLQRETRFSEERARFYIAELILALEHLHKYDIVYRDLKPENILLDATGHVALCDFGLSKPDLRSDELTNTFCGTTEYLAPEVLLDEHGYSKLVDFWSLGVLLFEMCCGWSPFYAEDTQQMYKNICFGKIRFPKGVINEDGKQFVKGLLNRNPKHRLGAQRDAAELKEHPFFKTIDWDALAKKQATPPFKPAVESDESVANFDPEFTTADIREAGPNDIMDLDEEDPSEDWVQLSQSITGSLHTPNGPLGSDRAPKGIEIAPRRRKKREQEGSPLTSSVQENFRGFTYHGGESVMAPAAGLLAEKQPEEHAVQDDELPEHSDDDLVDDMPAGRYARRRKDDLDGFDEDMHV